MSDIAVRSRRYYPSPKQTRAVDLQSQKQEAQQAQAESISSQVPAQEFEEGTRREDGMRKQKSGQPGRSACVIKPSQRRPIGGVEVEGKRTDHNNDFEHDQAVEDRNRTRKPAPHAWLCRGSLNNFRRRTGCHRYSKSARSDYTRNALHARSHATNPVSPRSPDLGRAN